MFNFETNHETIITATPMVKLKFSYEFSDKSGFETSRILLTRQEALELKKQIEIAAKLPDRDKLGKFTKSLPKRET